MRDRRQHARGEHPQDGDRRRQRPGHHRAGRRRGPEPVPRPAARPRSRSIASTGYTSTGVDPTLVDFFNSLGQNGATVGLPFAVYPSFIFYNKDLFDEAGLPLPADQGRRPVRRQAVGPGRPPHAGHEAHRRQERQRRDQRRLRPRRTSSSGASTPSTWTTTTPAPRPRSSAPARSLAADGKTAAVPDYIAQGEKWYNDGVWKDHFIPTATQVASDLLGGGNEFASGNLAIDEGHTWFTCCVDAGRAGKKPVQVRLRRRPRRQRQDHLTAARRHVQHPQDHQGPGRGLQGPHRAWSPRAIC